MGDERKSGDHSEKVLDGTTEAVPNSITEEVQVGAEEHTQGVTEYYQARKQGLRDKHTGEHLGAQPEFFDSGGSVIGNDKQSSQVKPETFYPKNGVYSPIAPPGVGDSEPGKIHEDEFDAGPGNYAIDRRDSETEDNGDGTVTHTYKGELEDSGWDAEQGVKTDTKFNGNETWTKDNRLLERHVEYRMSVDMKFKTPEGEKEIPDVKNVDTVYNPKTGNFHTVVTTLDGTKYRADTSADGSVSYFYRSTGDVQVETEGLSSTNAGSFRPDGEKYNPVRPQGVGEMNPGQASWTEKSGIDWRQNQAELNPDGSRTFRYRGALDDGGASPWDWGETDYEASETLDSKGKIVETHVEYRCPVDQKFTLRWGKDVEIPEVTKVDTKLNDKGRYETEVTSKDGRVWIFITNPDGEVVDMLPPGYYR